MSSVDVLYFLSVYCTFQCTFVQHESDGLQLAIECQTNFWCLYAKQLEQSGTRDK